jgi:transcription elongation factor Elf1
MFIREIVEQHRRDFTATYQCEHCNVSKLGQGYDDENFHANVIPNMVCASCGKKASSGYRPLKTVYEAHEVI